MTLEQFEAIEKYFMALIKDDNSIEDSVYISKLRFDIVEQLLRRLQND